MTDRWVFTKLDTHDSKLVRALPPLGRTANYSRLWWAVSGALVATRNRRARRAALRGMIGVALASFAANVVGKRVFRRPRPPIAVTPVHRRLRRAPITTSFPSGHTASAAAFATGVALEWPLLAAPVGALAAGVAASRVVTGAHYPSDVLAGGALGLGAGALTLWWWPRTMPGPPAAEAAVAPALPTGAGAAVIVNPSAGSAEDGVVAALSEHLPDAEILEAGEGADLPGMLADAASRCRVLGVAGGDGTINLAARIAAEHDLPLLVIPAGTLNHFARDVGIDSVPDAIQALRSGAAVRVDLGRVDDQVFVNTCSTGLYTDLVHYREKWERRLGKWPAVLVGLVHLTRRAKPQELVIDGRRRRVWMVFVGNGEYQPAGFAPTSRVRLGDGLLDVRIIGADRPWARTRIVLAVLTGTLRWCRPYQEVTATELKIEAVDGRLQVTVDGEFTSVEPAVTVRKREGLTVYRPLRPAGPVRRNGRTGS
jgi:diacylglycerol kinase family enzyme/membrane-associated phospholipid phosphatase